MTAFRVFVSYSQPDRECAHAIVATSNISAILVSFNMFTS